MSERWEGGVRYIQPQAQSSKVGKEKSRRANREAALDRDADGE